MVRIGEAAPQFSLPTDSGGRASLSDYAGKKVVLYFYPKDDTPGCTKEACEFRDNLETYHQAGAVVLGVSPDGVQSHQEFKAKYQLTFPLLADEDHAVAEAYGAWKEKSLYGRTFMGIERTTVLIDEQQKISAIFNRVQVDGHSAHVLAVLKGEQPAPTPIEHVAKPSGGDQEAPKQATAAKPAAKKPAPAKKAPAKAKAKAKAKPKAAKKAVKKVAKKVVKKPAKKVAKKPTKKPAKKTAKKAAKKKR